MKVTEIKFEVVVNGKRRVYVFVRNNKIAGLLQEEKPLGKFLEELCTAPPAGATGTN